MKIHNFLHLTVKLKFDLKYEPNALTITMLIVNSANKVEREIMFSLCLSVCLFVGMVTAS